MRRVTFHYFSCILGVSNVPTIAGVLKALLLVSSMFLLLLVLYQNTKQANIRLDPANFSTLRNPFTSPCLSLSHMALQMIPKSPAQLSWWSEENLSFLFHFQKSWLYPIHSIGGTENRTWRLSLTDSLTLKWGRCSMVFTGSISPPWCSG